MNGTIHERISTLVDVFGDGKNTIFASKLDVSEGNIRGYIKGVMPKQDVLEKIKDTPEEDMISKYMLRSLMKADYKPENLGHFGLAAKYYCHFTSPIRRYPDLTVHRILKDFLDGKPLDDYELNVDGGKTSL